MVLPLLQILLCGYLLGSIPNGYILGRLRGVDLRQQGSGNIGATNAFRFLGKKWGILVFVLDFAKGLAAVLLAEMIGQQKQPLPVDLVGILGGVSSILGHNFPIWLGFKGGKGIATSAGVLVGLLPFIALILMCLWIVLFWFTRYVSIASIGVAVALPVLTAINVFHDTHGWWLLAFSAVVGVLAVWRHRDNIARLRAGTEHRFARKKEAPAPES